MNIQEKILNKIEEVVVGSKAEYVVNKNAANTGTVYVMDDFDVLLVVDYDFQSDYAKFQVYGHGVDVSNEMDYKKIKQISIYYNKNLKEKIVELIDYLKVNIANK